MTNYPVGTKTVAFLAVAMLALAGIAGAQCDDGETGSSSWRAACNSACSGSNPNATPLCTLDVQVRSKTFCRNGGWLTLDGSWQPNTKTDNGTCGTAPAGDPPQCMPAMTVFQRTSVSGTTINFKVATVNGLLSGPTGCQSGSESEKTWSISGQGCCASGCAQPTACAALGKQYTSSTCTCEEPPYDPCANGGCTPGYHQEIDCHSEVPVDECGCCYDSSPIVISLRGNGYKFSNARNGVIFDINGLGKILWIAWPVQPDDAWLALDRNGNGTIDSGAELFGNVTRLGTGITAANGYQALAEYDANADGVIDKRDPIFVRLRLWADANRDGQSQSDELIPLDQANVKSLSLRFKTSNREDRHGNQFRYRAEVTFTSGVRRFSYDVFPVAAPVAGLTPVAVAACSIEPTTKTALPSTSVQRKAVAVPVAGEPGTRRR